MDVGTSKKWMNEAIPERSSDSNLQAKIPREGQDQVRKGVMKEINRVQQKQGGRKVQKQADMVQKTDVIGQHSGSCQAPEQSQSVPAKAMITLTDEFFETLMDAPNQLSLRKILSLVPNFAHQFMQRLAQEYGFSVEQIKAWGEEILSQEAE
ncbi:hypothetical protein GOP47_0030678, partial [Adiantum capillus-veneris]